MERIVPSFSNFISPSTTLLNPAEALSAHRHYQAESAVRSKLAHNTLPDPNLGEVTFLALPSLVRSSLYIERHILPTVSIRVKT